MIDPCPCRESRAGNRIGFVYHVINRGNGRATIFHKPQDYFGLRLFQTFQKSALSLSKGSIAALRSSRGISPFESFQSFNRFAPFKALRRFKVQGSRVQSNLRAVYKSSSCSNGPGPQTKDLELAA